MEEYFLTIVNDCKAKENANDEDAAIVVNHEVPETTAQKCLFACFYETLGVVSFIFVKLVYFLNPQINFVFSTK